MKNIAAREPPSMTEAETYWKSLWGEEAQHNERAEWIRREEKGKIRYMDWRPIHIMEIMLKNKCCLYVIISIQFFSIMICNLLIEFPSYFVLVKSSQLEISWK